MVHVSQIIMLYTLNLHSAVCQLYLNKTRQKEGGGGGEGGRRGKGEESAAANLVSPTAYTSPRTRSKLSSLQAPLANWFFCPWRQKTTFFCCYSLGHFLSWTAGPDPELPAPVSLGTSIPSYANQILAYYNTDIHQTYICIKCPDWLVAVFYSIVLITISKKEIMKIYLNVWVKEGDTHPSQALIFCLRKRFTQQILFYGCSKRGKLYLSFNDSKFSTRNKFSWSVDICLVRGPEIFLPLRFFFFPPQLRMSYTHITNLKKKYITSHWSVNWFNFWGEEFGRVVPVSANNV